MVNIQMTSIIVVNFMHTKKLLNFLYLFKVLIIIGAIAFIDI